MVARNCDFARFAASAASLATFSEAAARSTSRLCRIARTVVLPNSLEARSIVTPNRAISTASGSDTRPSVQSVTAMMPPSSGTASRRNDRPISAMNSAATAIEPQAKKM